MTSHWLPLELYNTSWLAYFVLGHLRIVSLRTSYESFVNRTYELSYELRNFLFVRTFLRKVLWIPPLGRIEVESPPQISTRLTNTKSTVKTEEFNFREKDQLTVISHRDWATCFRPRRDGVRTRSDSVPRFSSIANTFAPKPHAYRLISDDDYWDQEIWARSIQSADLSRNEWIWFLFYFLFFLFVRVGVWSLITVRIEIFTMATGTARLGGLRLFIVGSESGRYRPLSPGF